jgi:hypothetical protein
MKLDYRMNETVQRQTGYGWRGERSDDSKLVLAKDADDTALNF